ncbi:LOW QUALITY PROTEIN: RNA-binding protein MEX3A [Rhinatrema bivittatum]|uniref:LOW QUALITY PROTEIN: RNA-binding protein MEX3A n=1 Tax=Rhinatrema bivittatum TaxID=194408 RepID=UPI001127036A|nr:LOW QUALITY PROTEIN: RNA-binding protein MEX3A [Rhinatrema bivittatum]
MPSLVLSEMMERNGVFGDLGTGLAKDRVLEDDRALQLALDQLCLLGLGGEAAEDGGGGNNTTSNSGSSNSGSSNSGKSAGPKVQEGKLCALYKEAELRLKSSNTTECVPVPSSEHVAEIVGRQGCKIKALRAKTNTYIKTPVRGEEPVFMVTGRREDVAMARREIISAAEHFSMIRASRNKRRGAGAGFSSAPTLPGQVTIRVRVPYRVVGLVVGPKGATVKRIQQQTSTYILTPSRDRDPVFEITGAPGNVERAREEIETHIAVRTGKILEYGNENELLPAGSSSPEPGYPADGWRSQPASGCKPLSTFRQNSLGEPGYETPRLGDQAEFGYGYLFPGYSTGKQDGGYYGAQEAGSPAVWAGQENSSPGSVFFCKQQQQRSGCQRSASSQDSLPRRCPGEALAGFSKLAGTRGSVSGSRECMVCFESEVTAALVPCGHNLFCMECAVRICERNEPECPVCHSSATQAIRIFS